MRHRARLGPVFAALALLALAVPAPAQCPGASYALRFDGVDDLVDLGLGDGIYDALDRNFTCEAWLRLDAEVEKDWATPVSTGYEPYCSDFGFWLLAFARSGEDCEFWGSVAVNGCVNDTAIGSSGHARSVWHHVAETFEVTAVDGAVSIGTLRLYVDGVWRDERTDVRFATEARPFLRFGATSFAGHLPGPPYFEGLLDEVRIWNRTRSQEEITATMHHTLVGDEDGLLGYWPFDEGSGDLTLNRGNPASWIWTPFGWDGLLGGTFATEPSDPLWVVSDAPVCIPDCDGNGVDDSVDLENGTYSDVDGNGIPDVCQALRVDSRVAPGGDGRSWATAFHDLQDALAATSAERNQIWVVTGIYEPGTGRSFEMKSGVALYGGFRGDETRVEQRNWNRPPRLDARHQGRVVQAIGVDETAILDGFLISGGAAVSRGAGIYLEHASATIRNCAILGCIGTQQGAALCNVGGSPTLIDVHFISNSTLPGGRGGAVCEIGGSGHYVDCEFRNNLADRGGAVNLGNGSKSRFDRCTFEENRATPQPSNPGGGALFVVASELTALDCSFFANSSLTKGGAGFLGSGEATFLDCRFLGNSAGRNVWTYPQTYGGALYVENARTHLVQCVLDSNQCLARSPYTYGGAIYHRGTGNLEVANCTFWNNRAEVGGAVRQNLGPSTYENCVFHGNVASSPQNRDLAVLNDPPSLWDCCVQTGWNGPGGRNFSADPLFRDPRGPDRIAGTLDDDLRLNLGSPCIDLLDESLLPPDLVDLDADGDFFEPIPLDLDHLARLSDGDGDGTWLADLGPTEFPDVVLVENWDDGETLVLSADGGVADPLLEVVLEATNTSGTDDARLLFSDDDSGPPGGLGFQVFGHQVHVETDLADGAFWMRVSVPFEEFDLGGIDPLTVDLATFCPTTFRWIPAAAKNTVDSPGHASRLGDRFADVGSFPPVLSTDLGDYGVFWNPTEGRGFAWANVDHTTLYGAGFPGDCDGDGIADYQEILAGTETDCLGDWIPDSCDSDCNGNGVPDRCDIANGTSLDRDLDGIPDECQDPDPMRR